MILWFNGLSLMVSNNGFHVCELCPAAGEFQRGPLDGGGGGVFPADLAAAVSLLAMEAKSMGETSGWRVEKGSMK